jgi:hypothetical protein
MSIERLTATGKSAEKLGGVPHDVRGLRARSQLLS